MSIWDGEAPAATGSAGSDSSLSLSEYLFPFCVTMGAGEGGVSGDGEGSDIEGMGGWVRMEEAVRQKRQQGRPQERPGGKTVEVTGNLGFGDPETPQKQCSGCF